MDTFQTVLALISLFALLAAAPLYWHFKDLAIDRQLRRAERPAQPERAVAATYGWPSRNPRLRRTTTGQAH
ncbi:hypothetical protein ACFY7Z_02455 [Streptomyces sp. NPDC012623]|uniref:hypothetical protein n=1 Tax=unclassified Streptomyces TaxID=2593676 RepID=UPI0036BE4D9F